MELKTIQNVLADLKIDGWLLCDFHNRDPIAYRVLGLDFGKFTSRRWFYFIPAVGEPVRLVHRVEPTKLDGLPGRKTAYLAWTELHEELRRMLGPSSKRIAMQYSPLNSIPYVALVDAGTVELVRGFGHEVVSSADLVQLFEAVISEEGYRSHLEASRLIHQIKDEAFDRVRRSLREGKTLTEYELQRFIVRRFEEEKLTCMDEFPIVGVNDHPANPHFEPTPSNARPIRKGDTLLIDLWAKQDEPGAIFADITWCGYVGSEPPAEYQRIFGIARDARNAAVSFVRGRFAGGIPCYGWEVDDACRRVVRDAGYGPHFIHRTGHSIGENVHGNGVHIDNLETREERRLIPGICFSVEPGIYLEGKMAVRTEVDVFITLGGEVVVAGEEQNELIRIEA
ncbi:MAG: M24 family metallopeptidase [bacterium]|nr:M24 family metallopeptidase [bacterium]